MTPPNTLHPLRSFPIRSLGVPEQLFWWMNRTRSGQFTIAAEITGSLSESALHQALRALQARHPLLTVSVQEHAEGDAHTPVFVMEPDAPIPLRVIADAASADWHARLQDEFTTPLDAAKAPLVRAALLQGADRATLLLTFHHSISDGISAKFLVRDLLQALSGTALEPLPMPPSIDERLHTAAHDNPATQASKPAALAYAPPRVRPQIVTASLDAQTTSALRECARHETTTLNGALCAALVIAGRKLYAEWRGRNVRINSPVSYRKILNVSEDNGLFIGPANMSFPPAPKAAFWETARSAREQVAKAVTMQAAADAIEQMAAGLRMAEQAGSSDQVAAAAFASDIMLTNIGEVSYATEFGAFQLEALWSALFMGFAEPPTLSALTTNGRLNLLMTGYRPVQALMEELERVLRQACRV